ncbi:MAG: CotH kinase family protein [Saprospiraceae bacterium]|nr:CotH kinase family protein [Saprospiraceae bacterium]
MSVKLQLIITGIIVPFLLFNVLIFRMNGQSLPSEYYFSQDGKILYCGGKPSAGLYDKSGIRDIHINFSQPDYWTKLKNNYATETNLAASMTVDGITYNDVGVRFRGNTSYMMIQNSDKKSFAVETDFVDPDQTLMGYKNLKFNNAHEDATFMREVLYARMAAKYTPVAKTNYIHLYINNLDWGIYPNIQSIDKTMLEEWFLSNDGARFRATTEETGIPGGPGGPQWGDGTAGMNYLGADSTKYQKYYALKSSDIADPWKKLIEACEALSKTSSSNYADLKTMIDIDKVLWFLAVENIFTDDDSYTMKGKMDYIVYYEPETGRSTAMEYDGNTSFQTNAATSTNWGPFKNASNQNYPLLYKLLNIPEYRQRYLAHYRTILKETFTTENANSLIDETDKLISSVVASDPKKLYSVNQYISGLNGLKTFVSNRRTFLLSNSEVVLTAPVISSASFYNEKGVQFEMPKSGEKVFIRSTVNSGTGISKVNLYYAAGLVGVFNVVQMFDDGNHNDIVAGDGVFGAEIPGFEGGTLVRYYIEAIANNTALTAAYLPSGAEHDVFYYNVLTNNSPNGVVINELMASNTKTAIDENGEYEDWIELFNTNDLEVDLGGFYLSDKATDIKKWQIPAGIRIPAKGYLIIWADEDQEQGQLHANFKLSKSGEDVVFADSQSNILDQVSFGEQTEDKGYARVPNGTGDFKMQAPTFNANNDNISATAELNQDVKFEYNLFPVPAWNVLNIETSDNIEGKLMQIRNSHGQLVKEFKPVKRNKIDISSLPSGLYFVTCEGLSKKFIKN